MHVKKRAAINTSNTCLAHMPRQVLIHVYIHLCRVKYLVQEYKVVGFEPTSIPFDCESSTLPLSHTGTAPHGYQRQNGVCIVYGALTLVSIKE